jgi:peptide/nickel transport system substrate-binding protein
MTFDRNMQLQPELAGHGRRTEDLTFNPRKGVKFHDGKDFTAKDVVYTFQRIMDPATDRRVPDASFLKPEGIKASTITR